MRSLIIKLNYYLGWFFTNGGKTYQLDRYTREYLKLKNE